MLVSVYWVNSCEHCCKREFCELQVSLKSCSERRRSKALYLSPVIALSKFAMSSQVASYYKTPLNVIDDEKLYRHEDAEIDEFKEPCTR